MLAFAVGIPYAHPFGHRGVTHSVVFALVMAVVFVFVRRAAPTIAAGVTVPLSLAGTFACMYAARFSIDNISLMAVIVAVALINVPTFARQIRATVLTVRHLDYVIASRAFGCSRSGAASSATTGASCWPVAARSCT